MAQAWRTRCLLSHRYAHNCIHTPRHAHLSFYQKLGIQAGHYNALSVYQSHDMLGTSSLVRPNALLLCLANNHRHLPTDRS